MTHHDLYSFRTSFNPFKTSALPFTPEELTNLGYEIEYIPSFHLNRLTVEMKGREIFRCDIRNLVFNMHYCDDVVGKRVVGAVEEARSRMYHEDNIPASSSVKEGMRLLQKQAKTLQEQLTEAQVLYEIPANFHLSEQGLVKSTMETERMQGEKVQTGEKVQNGDIVFDVNEEALD